MILVCRYVFPARTESDHSYSPLDRQLQHAERAVRAFLARDYSTSSFGSRSNHDIKAELRAMLELTTEDDDDERE